MSTDTNTRRTRRHALLCAVALAGGAAVVGPGAAPVAARPDYGTVAVERPVAPARPTCGTSDTVARPPVKAAARVRTVTPVKAGPWSAPQVTRSGDVRVDGGMLLR